MIRVRKGRVCIKGTAPVVMTEANVLLSSLADALKKQGLSKEEINKEFHRMADKATASPTELIKMLIDSLPEEGKQDE